MEAVTDREAWLARRRRGIGASDVAGILGISAWATPWSVWADKVGLTPSKDEPNNEVFEFGHMAEPMLRDYFHRRTGLEIVSVQRECQHPDHPWALATLDGEVIDDGQNAIAVFEGKTTREGEWEEIPRYYQAQAQWQMFVTGHERVEFGVLHMPFGRPMFRRYVLPRDEEDIAFIFDRVRRFWFDHVTTGIAPDVDGSEVTRDAISVAYAADPEAEAVVASDEILRVLSDLEAAEATLTNIDDYVGRLKNRLREAMGEATVLVAPPDDTGKSRTLATWREERRTRFDKAAAEARYPRLISRFTTSSTSRVLRVK